jgi:hypothetical protein
MQTLLQRIISKVTSKKAGLEDGEKLQVTGRRYFLFSSVWLGVITLVRSFVWPATAMAASLVGKKKSTLPEVGKDLLVDKQPDGGKQVVVSDWPTWINGAKRGIEEGVPTWVQGLKLHGVVINGPIASGGHLVATNVLKPLIVNRMLEAGAPQSIVDGFMGAVTEAWQAWMASVSVPFLPWYPAFAVVPAPYAPPCPNFPMPLITLAQNPMPLLPETLAAAIKGRIGEAANLPGGVDAINEFCRWLNIGFVKWLPMAQVMFVMGQGPVPTFAPPTVPVGPVVGGNGESLSSWFQPLMSNAPSWL